MASTACVSRIIARSFLRKNKRVIDAENKQEVLERNLDLWDLLGVGVGGTVGSGVFVLTGMIAHDYAGSGVVLSWLIAGICCLFRCLSLEYGISGAAVARSWGEKVGSWLFSLGIQTPNMFCSGDGINLFAGFLQLTCTLLLMTGVELGRLTVNIFSSLKVCLVIFMVIVGLAYFRLENLNISSLAANGAYAGIMRGATSAFFGYVGYDEVCCLAAETKDASRTLPLAVFGTVGIVTLLYFLASFALVGLLPSESSAMAGGFASAFAARGNAWAQQVVAIGELVTLPVVVLVSFLAQPRLQFAVAKDGLMPRMLAEVDRHGNLVISILLSGILCTIIACIVPFTHLNDMISGGVLLSFNMTNTSLVILRRDKEIFSSCGLCFSFLDHCSGLGTFLMLHTSCGMQLFIFHLASICLSLLIVNISLTLLWCILCVFVCVIVLLLATILLAAGTTIPEPSSEHYLVPFMPAPPLVGILVNYYLLAQLSFQGLFMIASYIACATLSYYVFGFYHSVGNNSGWRELLIERENGGEEGSSPSEAHSVSIAYVEKKEELAYQSLAFACIGERGQREQTGTQLLTLVYSPLSTMTVPQYDLSDLGLDESNCSR